MMAPDDASEGRLGRGWAWLGFVGMALGCVGLPPPPPEEASTSEVGTTSGGPGPSSTTTTSIGLDETTALGDSGTATTMGSSGSEGDPCLDVDCPAGEQCADGECVPCPEPICEGCGADETCQCPVQSFCCDFGVCVGLSCDPILQDCAAGEACYPVGKGWSCAPDESGTMGAFGDPCEFVNACDPGGVCLTQTAVPNCMSVGCCSWLCDLTDPGGDAQCMAGQMCTPWYEPGAAPPGYEDVGACALPM